jgi:hypothetical protein
MDFELPPGDPDAIQSALNSWASVAADLKTQESATQSGFAAALGTWTGARADDFRAVSAGLQLQVHEAQATIEETAAQLRNYAAVLRNAIEEIKHLQSLANARQASADTQTNKLPAGSTQIDEIQQHAAMYVGSLMQQAETLRQNVRKAAEATAGVVDAGTSVVVPAAQHLTPAEIARRVDQSTGVVGIQQAINGNSLTADQAWAALNSAAKEVPGKAVNPDGSINWEELSKELTEVEQEEAENPAKKALDGALDLWTLSTAPPSGWALARLAEAARNFHNAESALPPDLARLNAAALDRPTISMSPDELLDSIERDMSRLTPADEAAFAANADVSEATESLLRNGLPASADWLVKGSVALGAIGDVWTLADPHSATDDKVDAGLNAVGLAATTETGSTLITGGLEATGLIAADATVGWVPVVGWGLVAGTAGYELWKHREAVGNFVTHTVPNFVTNTVPHAVSGAVHAVGSFVSDHIPHVHLW